MADNRELPDRSIHEVSNNPVKLDQVRNITGGTLLRTIPASQQTRFVMAAPVQSSTALISTTSTIQAQVLPKVTVQGSAQTQMNRINPAVPIQATSAAGYHVPRGAAAVANIAVPRSSVATPMVRGPATLQTIGVATAPAHSIPAGNVPTTGPIVGRSVVGVTPWVATCLAQQATTRQTPPPSQHQIRPPPASSQQIQVSAGSRLVSGQMRPVGDNTQQTRPVLLHATTHKQLTLTQQAHIQNFVDGATQQSSSDKPVTVKSYGGAGCNQGNRGSTAAASSLSRLATALPPAVVSLQPAVIVPTTQAFPVKGTTTTQAKVITQQTHGATTMQISTVPVSSVQPTIAINSVVSRPVMLANQATTSGSTVPSTVAMRGMASQQHVKVYSNSQASGNPVNSNIITNSTSNSTLATSMNSGDAITVPATTPVYIHATQHKTGANPQTVQSGAILVRPPHHQVKDPTEHQGLLPGSQGMRINSVMVVDSSRVQVHPFVAASEGVTMVADGGIAPTAMGTISITGSLSHTLIPKQNTSPRPSILRKRDPPEGSPMKAQKNLTPVLANMASCSSISSSCSVSPPPANPCSNSVVTPGSPRLSESAGVVGSGQCSSSSSGAGSTTLSANSSPGESPPIKLESQDDLDNTPAPTVATPIVHHQEMSPRKKPRKQQLTGNQITEPAFSEDEMEFISDEKIKSDHKAADENEEKCLPKRTMSLLNGYRHQWKSRNNHFLRYSDIRQKEERKPTLSELANQKHALQKLNGWKIYHLNSQMEDMVNSETEFFGLYTSLLSSLEIKQKKCKNKDIDREISRINERIRANFQRSKVVRDQIQEAKVQVMKLFKHKNYVADIINRNVTKRPIKKRERI